MAEIPQLSGIHAGVCPPLTAPDKGSVRGGGGQVPPGPPTCPGSALVSARPDSKPGVSGFHGLTAQYPSASQPRGTERRPLEKGNSQNGLPSSWHWEREREREKLPNT